MPRLSWCKFISMLLFATATIEVTDGIPQKLTTVDGKYALNHTGFVGAGEIVLYTYAALSNDSTVTVRVTSYLANIDAPLQIYFRTASEVFTAQLPWIITELENTTLTTVTETVCLRAAQLLQVEISTFDTQRTHYIVEANVLDTSVLYISPGRPKRALLRPTEAKFFTFCFTERMADVLLLKITSKDRQCALVGFHGGDYCDSSHHLQVGTSTLDNGFVQSMMTLGGTALSKKHIRLSDEGCFHVEFVLEPTNLRCITEGVSSGDDYSKEITLQNEKDVTLYVEEVPRSSYMPLVWFTLLVVLTGVFIAFFCTLTPVVKVLQKSSKAKALDPLCPGDLTLAPKGSYLCTLAVLAVFYLIPALQLLYQYLDTIDATGNQDLCYYNFLCAKQLGPFFAFNNVYSNLGYVFYGLMFILIVKRRKVWWRYAEILYAMGLALILEGILSAAYHVCPKVSNFQFDTTFMYITAGLCIYYLHYVRNPVKPLHSHWFFTIFAAISVMVVLSIILQVLEFRIFLTVVYVITVINFGVAILGVLYVDNAWAKGQVRAHKVIGSVHFAINLLLLAFSLYTLYTDQSAFPSILLNIFIGNLFLFTAFYIILKCLKREVVVCGPILCLIFACACWTVSLYLFNLRVTDWRESAAQSREKNQECVFLGFFDQHDVWHWLSGLSLYVSFLLFLTIDDGQSIIVRREIELVANFVDAACETSDAVNAPVQTQEETEINGT